MTKTLIFAPIIAVVAAAMVLVGVLVPQTTSAAETSQEVTQVLEKIEGLTKCGIDKDLYGVKKTVKMLITAYTSDPWETDDTPTIAASGKTVFDGMVANNGLKFGTKVRMPELFGDKVFVVEDRMHPRKGKLMMDIWMAEKKDAKHFGAKLTTIEILES